LVLDAAESKDEVGEIGETLKWEEPAYPAPLSNSGSNTQIGWKESRLDQYPMFFECAASLVLAIRERTPRHSGKSVTGASTSLLKKKSCGPNCSRVSNWH
jgi:hypothetical protein